MKAIVVLCALVMCCLFSNGQDAIGKWTTVDDNTGKDRSVVEIFERQGKIFGKITKLYREPGEDPDPVCDECSKDDARHNKKVIGMEIIQNMIRSGNEYTEGNILDPENGKIYRCKLWVEENVLKVRGYWGPFYRTQTWKKVN
ncbi:MAG: DUF2147 domain-containing protein [Flammeovirgaceae bacterium]|nr:DUF2147 domain-containing protein [Flammeovirgaceae bacterium]